jgi:uroporphyrin-III C-methyltransferase
MTPIPTDAPESSANLSAPIGALPTAPSPWWWYGTAAVALVGLLSTGLLWQKVLGMQESLARQSAESVGQATQAVVAARQAQDLALETAAKLTVTQAKLSEVTMQRGQIEELIQSLSRSRDENLVVDIESALLLAQQQAQLTGSVAPLLAALKSSDLRLTRAAQPRLAPLQRAIAKDVARIQATALSDTPSLLVQLDELALLADDLPIANAVGQARVTEPLARKPDEAVSQWWLRMGVEIREEIKSLVRVSHISEPDAALLSPDQSFFLRENLKLRILNARLGLLSRQIEPARADLATASLVLGRYFAPGSRKTQTALALLKDVQGKMRALELPRVDETLSALSTAAAGR